MSYIVPIHRPSSARLALKLNFLNSNEEAVIVAYDNRARMWLRMKANADAGKQTDLKYTASLPKADSSSFIHDLFMGTLKFWNLSIPPHQRPIIFLLALIVSSISLAHGMLEPSRLRPSKVMSTRQIRRCGAQRITTERISILQGGT